MTPGQAVVFLGREARRWSLDVKRQGDAVKVYVTASALPYRADGTRYKRGVRRFYGTPTAFVDVALQEAALWLQGVLARCSSCGHGLDFVAFEGDGDTSWHCSGCGDEWFGSTLFPVATS